MIITEREDLEEAQNYTLLYKSSHGYTQVTHICANYELRTTAWLHTSYTFVFFQRLVQRVATHPIATTPTPRYTLTLTLHCDCLFRLLTETQVF